MVPVNSDACAVSEIWLSLTGISIYSETSERQQCVDMDFINKNPDGFIM